MRALVTSVFLLAAKPGLAAPSVQAEVAAAVQLYASGKAETARETLERALGAAQTASPDERMQLASALLDICLHNRNDDCVARHVMSFVAAAGQAPAANAVQRGRLALQAVYYLDAARWRSGVAPAAILAEPSWSQAVAFDGDLYLRREVLASNLLYQAGRTAELDRALDKVLSLVGSLTNPGVARFTVATSLADVLDTLQSVGETERAWGLWRAAGADIARALPPLTLDAALLELTQAQLLQQVGDLAGARATLQPAAATLRQIELTPAVRRQVLARVVTLQAALDALAGDLAAARADLADHPFAALYAAPGRAPASFEEVTYLTARGLLAALENRPDPVAAQALQAPVAFASDAETTEEVAVYRAAGEALALPPGPERRARLVQLGRRLRDVAVRSDRAGELSRLDVIAQTLVGLALAQADAARTPAEADAVFTLFQLAGRTGTSFDADALAALGRARDELQRRTLHQALRLQARRDRLERQRVQAAAAALGQETPAGLLQHDIPGRALLREYDERLASAEARLALGGLSIRGPRLTSLARLQAALAQDEAALAVAPTAGGLAYMCVRRERTFQAVEPADFRQLTVDAKIVQAALTATHPASDALDAQFPAEAAVRLYGALLKPFEPCLKPNDRIAWLGAVASTAVPLAALLPAVPPKLARGYDLAAADWVVRRHAVSYAGSAAALVALRARGARPAADFDFLGVGDPRLGAAGGAGRPFEGLAPLPETREELAVSARGFRTARLLLAGEATEAGFRRELAGDYRYLSFATHGLLRDDLQGLADPALVLTPGAAAGPGDDGLLTASEIADMNLHASFVALSACNTANFDFDRIAQDLPALASAFAVSGVPATLGTLWPVNSRTGEAVVSGVFERLRARGGVGPAQALAEAQRAFLAAPPGRAYLHPRFWAPFVVLGDGAGEGPRPAPGLTLSGVETVSGDGGEVMALAATAEGVAARFSAEPGAGVRLASAAGEAWRQVDQAGRASRVLGQAGPLLMAGGYLRRADGVSAPQLAAYDPQGRQVAGWTGETPPGADGGILAAAQDGPGAMLILLGELDRSGEARGDRLRLMRVGGELSPTPLFEIAPPAGARITAATVTRLGERLLITYTGASRREPQPPASLDDYDTALCMPQPITWAELRDAGGKLLKAAAFENLAAIAAAPGPNGAVLVGGSRAGGCDGAREAAVLALDAELKARPLWRDETLGASEVRTLAALPSGRALAAAYKESLFEIQPVGDLDPERLHAGRNYSTLLVSLDRQGRPVGLKALDAGGDVLPTATLAVPGGEILLGGALAGRAAIFHLSVPQQEVSR